MRFSFFLFFFNDTATTEIYTLSLHDALPIYPVRVRRPGPAPTGALQPRPERAPGDGEASRAARADASDHGGGRARPGRGARHRARHSAGAAPPGLRRVLHDQTSRRGHRARPLDVLQHRRAASGSARLRVAPRRRRDLRRRASLPEGTELTSRAGPSPGRYARLGARATLPRTVGALLEVEHLTTEFVTRGGVVRAVDGVSWDGREGETMALVGESGCGKSGSALSVMRLVAAPAGRIG